MYKNSCLCPVHSGLVQYLSKSLVNNYENKITREVTIKFLLVVTSLDQELSKFFFFFFLQVGIVLLKFCFIVINPKRLLLNFLFRFNFQSVRENKKNKHRIKTHKGTDRGRNSQVGTNFRQNSRPYVVLKLQHDPNGYAYSPTQCLFFFGHGLHPFNVCSPLVTAYTHALFVFPEVTLILSMTRCICQLHPPVSLQIKATY